MDGEIAYISWLLPAVAVSMESPTMLRLKCDQAEITACETLPKYRGMGIYGLVIWQLLVIAFRQGITKLYMKTTRNKKSSQNGICKAGLAFAGLIVLLRLPLSGRTWVLRLYR